MRFVHLKLLLGGAALFTALVVSLSALAGGPPPAPYVSCDYWPDWTIVACGEKAKISGFYGADYECTVKVDCDSDDDEEIWGTVGIGFGTTYTNPWHPSGLPCYYARYGFVEDGWATCFATGAVNLEDSPETKVVCENDSEFTFRVECPHEEE